MQLTVRPAGPDDAAAIARAHAQAWRIGYAGILPAGFLASIDDDAWTANRRRAIESPRPGTHMFVVLAQGRIIGFAHSGPHRRPDGTPDDPPHGEVYAVYVHPDSWSIGAGYALMRTSVDHLASDGRVDIKLWTLEDNERSRRFYERFGFEADGERHSHPIGAGTEYASAPIVVRYTLRVR